MKEAINVIEFLKTGQLGQTKEIFFGMNRESLTEYLGETQVIHVEADSKFPTIYKYGKVEFYFEPGEDGRLHGIQIKPSIEEAPLHNLRIDYRFIKMGLNINTTKVELQKKGITFNLIRFEYDDDADPPRILTENGVYLIFNDEYEIEKVNRFVHLE